MGRSKEFNRDTGPEPEKMVTQTGPLGILPILYIVASVVLIIAVLFWWLKG